VIKEVPMVEQKIQIVEKTVEVPVEVIKVQEIEKIVEVFRDRYITKEEEDCDCLTGMRFIDVWNRLFHIQGHANEECLTEEEFVTLIQKNLN